MSTSPQISPCCYFSLILFLAVSPPSPPTPLDSAGSCLYYTVYKPGPPCTEATEHGANTNNKIDAIRSFFTQHLFRVTLTLVCADPKIEIHCHWDTFFSSLLLFFFSSFSFLFPSSLFNIADLGH